MPIGLWSYQKSEHQIRLTLQHNPHGQSGSAGRSLAEKELPKREPMQSSESYLLTNFFFAAASSLSFPSSTLGYARSSEARVSITAAATTTRVNHLLSAGTTYHGASFVAVS